MAPIKKKANMISQIVRLKQVVQRWKNSSLTRRRGSVLSYSSDDSVDSTDSNRRRTPSGSLAVYVGSERRRFVIPTRFLNLPVFVALLDQAEEEFGFRTSGGLVLPCEPDFFAEILRFLEEDEGKFCKLGIDEFLNVIHESFDKTASSCKESSSSSSCYAYSPKLAKTRVSN